MPYHRKTVGLGQSENLGLKLHEGKLQIVNARYGVEFLGVVVRPWRRELNGTSVERIDHKFHDLCAYAETFKQMGDPDKRNAAVYIRNSVNSLLGVMSHSSCHRLKQKLILRCLPSFWQYGFFDFAANHFRVYGDVNES